MSSRTMSGIPTGGGGGDGDAVLAGGTTASPQIFTGVNEFNGATNGNVGLIEQTATTTNTFIQENGSSGNFIEQSGTTSKGHIIQQGTNSVIRQNGDDTEIKQSGDDAEILQTGARPRIKQTEDDALIKQEGADSFIQQTGGAGCLIVTSGHVRTNLAPVIGNDCCNKTYVDSQLQSVLKTGFGQNFANNPVISYAVTAGNPTSSSGGDNLNGRMDTPASGLNADVTIPVVTGSIGETGNVKVDFFIVGEWSNVEWDKGIVLARAEQQADSSFLYNSLFRAQTDSSYPLTARCIAHFLNVGLSGNRGSTMEQATGFFVDDTAVAGKTYRYTPVLCNFFVGADTFKLNRTIANGNNLGYDRAVSCITAVLINV